MWKYIAGTIVIGSVTYGLFKYFAGEFATVQQGWMCLDPCSISSIVKFSVDTLKNEFNEIYALVTNAVLYHPQGLTEDEYEFILQTNYL
ncbi:hypothetical protein NQ317_013352, partial [Molorchus minor]